jgi:hypothetical protein
MKQITQEQLLKLNEVERCKILKLIVLGKIKYIGVKNGQ